MKPLNKTHLKMLPLHPRIIKSITPPNTTMMKMGTRVASTLATVMFIWAMLNQFIPYQLRTYINKYLTNLRSYLYPYIEVKILEQSEDFLKRSEAYTAVQSYLSSLSSNYAKRLTGEMGRDHSTIVLSLDEKERVEDEFRGAKVWWVSGKLAISNPRGTNTKEVQMKFYKLTFHKKHRELITGDYFKHVVKQGKEIKLMNRQRKLYTNCGSLKHTLPGYTMWSHMPFEHPATFDNLAMNPDKKTEIMEDLVRFSKNKEFYSRIGKAWKRGYLLFGPPGTGKSTMIAAMANLLKYDVYDLELTAVKDNTELRRLLIGTTSKSIIVIEDIDCSLDLTGQRRRKKTEDDEKEKKKSGKESEKMDENGNVGSKVTLSGLLNFIDGIWSSCGGERIIVFTTNYVEKLDPALIRRGRMDKHVEMSYCGFEGFKVLAKNYLLVDDHVMFDEIKRLLSEVEMTPADVAENLMPNSSEEDVDKCLKRLVVALEVAMEEVASKKVEEKTGEVKIMDNEI